MLKNKIIKLLVGTNNKGKLREIRDLLPKNLEIYSPKDFKMKSPLENGKTFKENSLIKAKFFSRKSKMTCLSDDSGLEIDVLNGDPGIYSARWGGKKGDFKKAMNRVFKELDKKDKNWKDKKIKGRFVCALTIYDMCKALSQDIKISDIQLEKKEGGKGSEAGEHRKKNRHRKDQAGETGRNDGDKGRRAGRDSEHIGQAAAHAIGGADGRRAEGRGAGTAHQRQGDGEKDEGGFEHR